MTFMIASAFLMETRNAAWNAKATGEPSARMPTFSSIQPHLEGLVLA
jgi:hypothetical protein